MARATIRQRDEQSDEPKRRNRRFLRSILFGRRWVIGGVPRLKSMPYHVYPRQDGAVVSHVEYDANLGIHGRLTAKPSPIGSTDSIADATEMAYAYLGRNPSGAVYIAGDDDLIYDVILNDGYHADQSKNEKLLCLSFSLLIFCFTAFASSTFVGAQLGSFLSFIGVSLLYIGITRTGIQNEVEGGVVCFIILVLLLLLLPAFAAAIDAYKRKNAAGNQAMHPSREVGRFDNGESLVATG